MKEEVKDRRKVATDRLVELWDEVHAIDREVNKLKAKYSSVGEDINLDEFELRSKLFLESCRKVNNNSEKIINHFKLFGSLQNEKNKTSELRSFNFL